MLFYFNGVRLKIEFGIVLVIALSMLFNSDSLSYTLLFASLHEIGHLICLYLFGGRAEQITFSYYGIGLKYNHHFSVVKELIFLLSGVIVNLIFAMLNVQRDINIILLLINIMPIYPLDGGRALKLVFNNVLSLSLSDKLFYFVSAITILLMIIYSIKFRSASMMIIVVYSIIYSFNNAFE